MTGSKAPGSSHYSAPRELCIDGVLKKRCDLMVYLLAVGYAVALTVFFPPLKLLNILAWAYAAVFAILIIYRPGWWLWGVL
jgi:presenilin-like A22 family membrane protease